MIIYSLFITTSVSLQIGGICLGLFALPFLAFYNKDSFKEIPFNIPILFFIIILILSSLFSQYPIASLEKTWSVIRKILVYYIVIACLDIKWAKRLIYILVISGSLGTFIKLELSLYENFSANRELGGLLGIILPFSISLFFSSKSIYSKICFSVILFLLLTLLLFTLTRGAWIGVIIAIVLVGILKDKKIWLLIPIFLLYGSIFQEVINRAVSISNPDYHSNLCRIYIWKEALEIVKKNPIIGIGASFKTSCNGEIHTHYHNNLLNVAVSCGLLGLFAFIWLLGEIFKYSIDALKNKGNEYLKLSIFAGLIIWFIHGLVDTTYLGSCGYLFWFITGLLVVINKSS